MIDSALAAFRQHFGTAATHAAAAPGRVNFIGEHTDYNDGFVLPFALDKRTLAVGALNGTRTVRLRTALSDGVVEVPLDEPILRSEPVWANYVRGVLAGYEEKGVAVPGFDAWITSDVPPGGGLSSSAALEVAMATLVEQLAGRELDRSEKALLCQAAEHRFAGVPCGIMDQFASVFGREQHLLLLDCRTQKFSAVPWPDATLGVLVINSGVHHQLASSEYARRRTSCEAAAAALGLASLRDATLDQVATLADPLLLRRARHIVTENARVLACCAALTAGDFAAAGALMFASHESLRADYEVSCAELDALVGIAQEIGEVGGVIGARMTGGGFGGSAIYLCRLDRVAEIQSRVAAAYEAKTGIKPAMFVTLPSAGAQGWAVG